MADKKRVLPHSDKGFDRRFSLVAQVTGEKTAGGEAAEWTHIPAEKVEELDRSRASWSAAFAKMTGPHTPVETAAKNAARGGSEPVLRKFIQRYLYDADDVVTNADLESMELPIHDHTYTRHSRPPEHVELEILPRQAGELGIYYRCVETNSRAKPQPGYKGLVLYLKVLEDGEAVPEPEALRISRLITRSPHIERFAGSLRGKRVAFSAAWENGSGEEGARCPCVVAVIP
jgi:hypothetical protein